MQGVSKNSRRSAALRCEMRLQKLSTGVSGGTLGRLAFKPPLLLLLALNRSPAKDTWLWSPQSSPPIRAPPDIPEKLGSQSKKTCFARLPCGLGFYAQPAPAAFSTFPRGEMIQRFLEDEGLWKGWLDAA